LLPEGQCDKSYADFLTIHRDTLLTSPPFMNELIQIILIAISLLEVETFTLDEKNCLYLFLAGEI